MPMHDLIPSFNAGEVSPLIDARTSLEKYKSACRTLENFIIMPYGGVNRRPGTEFVAEVFGEPIDCKVVAKQVMSMTLSHATMTPGETVLAIRIDGRLSVGDTITWQNTTGVWLTCKIHELSRGPWYVLADTDGKLIDAATTLRTVPFNATVINGSKARLFPFNYSVTTRFVLEFSHHYIRIFTGGASPRLVWSFARIVTGVTGAYQGLSPYSESDLPDIRIVQINDVVYIAHPKHPLFKLSRTSEESWTFDFVNYSFPPTMDENTESTATITPSATTGTITLTSSAGCWDQRSGDWFFDQRDVGSFWTISHRRESAKISRALTASGTSGSLQVVGDWEMSTTGTWAGDIYLERSEDNGTSWDVIRSWNSSSDRNYSTVGNQPFPALLRLRYAGSGTGRALLQVTESMHVGVVQITAVDTSAGVICNTATATVIVPLYAATATSKWAESAFSDLRGHAGVLTLHEQRLYLSGNNDRAMTVWGSQIDDFENFRIGTVDSDGISLTLASGQQNAIEWMLSQSSLITGTNGDEWTLGASDSSKTITATNIKAQNQSRYGSAKVQAILLAEVVLFIQRNARKVRELTYSFERDGWVAVDLTLLAEHITTSGISEVAYQQQPDSILWAIRGDGTLIGMTYERDQSVVGWHRHTTDGLFESVAVIHGNGTEDEVWLVVKRTIGGVDSRYVERFSLNWRDALDAGSSEEWKYLDSHKAIAVGYSEPITSAYSSPLKVVVNYPGKGDFSVGEIVKIEDMAGIFTGGTNPNDQEYQVILITKTTLASTLPIEKRYEYSISLGNKVTGAAVDCGSWSSGTASGGTITRTSTSAKIRNVDHLESETVTALNNGSVVTSGAVASGEFTFSVPASKAVVGLPYTSTLQPMRLNMDLQDGTSQGRKARVHGLTARLYKSRGGEAMTNAGTWYALGPETGVFTGDRKITLAGNFADTADVTLRQTKPFPLTVIAIIPKWDSFGSE